MSCKIFSYLLLVLFIYGCDLSSSNKKSSINLLPINNYKNDGFALIYNNNLDDIKKLENRSFNIYHKSLKKKTKVKITNPANGKYFIAEVKSNKEKFSNFYNSILSLRIA